MAYNKGFHSKPKIKNTSENIFNARELELSGDMKNKRNQSCELRIPLPHLSFTIFIETISMPSVASPERLGASHSAVFCQSGFWR